jgi:ATP-dependent RNA helicase DDX52/ROK1
MCDDEDFFQTLTHGASFAKQSAEVVAVHKAHGIKVSGNDVAAPIASFAELRSRFGFDRRILSAVAAAGIRSPTPVQMQAIPTMCGDREVIAVSATGSGKTLAFVLPIIHLATKEKEKAVATDADAAAGEGKRGYRAIVLSPTKELAQQTFRVF